MQFFISLNNESYLYTFIICTCSKLKIKIYFLLNNIFYRKNKTTKKYTFSTHKKVVAGGNLVITKKTVSLNEIRYFEK